MYGYNTYHEDIMNNLINAVNSGASSHAYIFEGPSGLGKLESARLFAAALTCLSDGSAPCGTCTNCIEAAADSNPDIIYVEKPKDKASIPIDEIRRLTDDCAVKPFNAPKKVYIIKDGSHLRPDAQNAFLKTFEEPPSYAVFIILVENSSVLLPTILSRAVLISFPSVPSKKVERILLERHPDMRERIPFLVSYCNGNPGTAEEILGNPNFEQIRNTSLEALPKLISHDKRDTFYIEDLIEKSKDNAEMIFDFWISFLRDILVLQCSAFDNAVNVDKLSTLKKYSEYFDEKQLVFAADTLVTGKRMLALSVKASAAAMYCAMKINTFTGRIN